MTKLKTVEIDKYTQTLLLKIKELEQNCLDLHKAGYETAEMLAERTLQHGAQLANASRLSKEIDCLCGVSGCRNTQKMCWRCCVMQKDQEIAESNDRLKKLQSEVINMHRE